MGRKMRKRRPEPSAGAIRNEIRVLEALLKKAGPVDPANIIKLQRLRKKLIRRISGSGYVRLVQGGLPSLGKDS